MEHDAVSQNKVNWDVYSDSMFVNKINIYFMQLSTVKSHRLPVLVFRVWTIWKESRGRQRRCLRTRIGKICFKSNVIITKEL